MPKIVGAEPVEIPAEELGGMQAAVLAETQEVAAAAIQGVESVEIPAEELGPGQALQETEAPVTAPANQEFREHQELPQAHLQELPPGHHRVVQVAVGRVDRATSPSAEFASTKTPLIMAGHFPAFIRQARFLSRAATSHRSPLFSSHKFHSPAWGT